MPIEDELRNGSETLGARESLWRAVRARDREADGTFVYAVRSTGIYCRPSCPARKPLRGNLLYFRGPEAAEQNGFKPCRRCHPAGFSPSDPRLQAVARACRAIHAGIVGGPDGLPYKEGHPTLADLGAITGTSPHQLARAFLRVMGITPRLYADELRMRRLKSSLREGNDVTSALYEAGFGSSSRLYERARPHLGMTPGEYRRGGAGMQIHYAITDSPLGRILVGATEFGISAVNFGNSDRVLRAELRREYPKADLLPAAPGRGAGRLGEWVEQIVRHLRGRLPGLNLPADVRATAFQRRVWEELRRIPYGATRTYAEIARSVGRPAAVRAVARACATNPVAVVVPCHRVVRKDGSLAGYRWGKSRKRALLDAEAAAQHRQRTRAGKKRARGAQR